MTDNEKTFHGAKKLYEVMHLTLKHYLPQGKPLPESYRDAWYEIFKIVDSGVLEEITNEPIIEEEVKQLDMLGLLFKEMSADMADKDNGTEVDKEKEKTN